MLRVTASISASGAKSYFDAELSKGDYYTGSSEIVGIWGGKGADKLGLQGDVTKDQFNDLVDNISPDTGGSLTAHQKSNRRAGYDFTFNAPKSLSVLYEHTQDEKLLTAFRESVTETMVEIEISTAARVRKNGKSEDRNTGNLIHAEFIHFTARPVDGVPDPHLHAHIFVMNATHDHVEDQWKAVQLGEVKADSPYYEAAFHSRLAAKLSDMGYGIKNNGRFWDIAGIDRNIIDKFSNRTREIDETADLYGITRPDSKSELAAMTREKKNTDHTYNSLREIWNNRLTKDEITALDNAANNSDADQKKITADSSFDYALQHHFERQSTVKLSRLKEEALRFSYGSVTPQQIAFETEAKKQHDLLVRKNQRGVDFATTKQVLQEEQDIIDFTRNGYNMETRLNPDYEIKTDYLSDEQKDAITRILTSRDTVTAIQGKAGVGKTTLMQEAVRGIEEGKDGNSNRTNVFAPSSGAVDVLKGEGFEDSHTVARLLIDEKLQQQVKNSVLWIDEAGLLSVKDTHRIFEIAGEQNARIILSGDVKQHSGIIRGDAFRVLQQYADLEPAQIDTIRRQQGEYREAVAAISEGDVTAGYNIFDKLGKIQQIEDTEKRLKILAEDYLETTTKQNKQGIYSLDGKKSALVVAPTHKEGEEVTAAIRQKYQDAEILKGEEPDFVTYKNRNLTEAQKGDTRFYLEGQSVRFHQKAKNIQNGDRLTIFHIDSENNIFIADNEGNQQQLDLSLADRFSVYQPAAISLQKGDAIRITENSKDTTGKHRLNNGAIYRVDSFTDSGDIKLSNGWLIDAEKGNFTHGYVTTSHSSQGKTVDHVFIAQSSDSFPASNTEQFYVSASRGKKDITIYTDDKQELLEQVKESGQRLSAVELIETAKQQSREKQRLFDKTIENLHAFALHVKDKAHNWLDSFRHGDEIEQPEKQPENRKPQGEWTAREIDRQRTREMTIEGFEL